jgi:putative sigma-54 modulation protein
VDVTISSRGTSVTPELEEFVREKVAKLDRYLTKLDWAEVHLLEEKNPRISDKEICEIHIEGGGRHIHCKASGPDEVTAVERTMHKVERNLRKLKTKEVNQHHHAGGRHDKHQEAEPLTVPDAADIEFVRQKQIVIDPMSPVEAVQQMELLGHDFFLFTNAEDGHASVVYKRLQGDYGLLERSQEG